MPPSQAFILAHRHLLPNRSRLYPRLPSLGRHRHSPLRFPPDLHLHRGQGKLLPWLHSLSQVCSLPHSTASQNSSHSYYHVATSFYWEDSPLPPVEIAFDLPPFIIVYAAPLDDLDPFSFLSPLVSLSFSSPIYFAIAKILLPSNLSIAIQTALRWS